MEMGILPSISYLMAIPRELGAAGSFLRFPRLLCLPATLEPLYDQRLVVFLDGREGADALAKKQGLAWVKKAGKAEYAGATVIAPL